MVVRIVNGIFSDATCDTGYFITDKQADTLCEWMESYASALELAWKKRGSEGDPKVQKFNVVRSFGRAIKKAREDWDKPQEKENNNGQK